ncbi:DUF4430 domain-containing protein [Tetragenococcus halophilus]|uniref:Transcobalamin-like C-terminal domain-containing protein n=1 Tax=Tetragenococcus halophilus (strain DSM 20338 / JCM 20259 / NCIMB 9735 / NBRC 12172) TaxID=945021 RepID=A0AAN1VRQ7_TETHN|nr:DUF4430 domain-containing protein [Tetragenococcus halophilus]NRR75563.1 DUF4430 domain-containing protein [Tetragenococcus halophilus]NWN99805.1 DUF4430 domain-containing protein [Tetragenococcus halophilus]QXN87461.1 DUF4430 domain-containing protein [Tetragenococcus halophilus]RQD33262.1 DUF4430 domain-containing protein [Tetragenococcus halophilus subsp. halophilus DSM 20339]WJS82628.1 DUF4430 domain-containing protein [Tetragenococcus halophilus]
MKKKFVAGIAFFSALFIVGCSNEQDAADTSEATSQTSQAQEEITATVEIEDEDQTVDEKEIETTTDETLMEVMQDNFDIEEDSGMITTIEDIEQDEGENMYWTYTINDEMVNTGADETTLEDNDQVVFTYDKME